MARKAIIDGLGRVSNIIEAPEDWPAPDGYTIRDAAPEDAVWQEPAPIRTITPREFMDRISMERQGEITAAAMQSPALLLWLIRLTGAVEVNLDMAETQAGVAALQGADVITTEEASALLA